ncbi:hypothetical protein EYC08_09570 [Tabrizicola sp. WMC-M-20]|nr:hypothetical protein EYC08_09570 [Tabrizicola sp. WMC-M-20]
MAAICALAGGMVGFGAALVSLMFFDAGLLTALAIWSGSGIGSMALFVALMLRRAEASEARQMAATTRMA